MKIPLFLNSIDGLRKTGDAPGHKPRLLLLVVLRILLVVVGSCKSYIIVKKGLPDLKKKGATLFLTLKPPNRAKTVVLPKKGCPIFFKNGQPFFSPWSPQIEPKPWYLRDFCNNQKSTCSKNTAICDALAKQQARNAIFYSVFEPPLKTYWHLQCF